MESVNEKKTIVNSLGKIKELAMQTIEEQERTLMLLKGQPDTANAVDKGTAPACLLEDMGMVEGLLVRIRNNAQDINSLLN